MFRSSLRKYNIFGHMVKFKPLVFYFFGLIVGRPVCIYLVLRIRSKVPAYTMVWFNKNPLQKSGMAAIPKRENHEAALRWFSLIWVQNMAIAVQKLLKFGWLISKNILRQHSKTNWWNVRVPSPTLTFDASFLIFSCESHLRFLMWMPIGRKSPKWVPEWLPKFFVLNLLCEYKILLRHHVSLGTDVSDQKKV